MSTTTRTTTSLRSRLAAIWSDIHYGQQRYIQVNRVDGARPQQIR